MPDIRVDRYNGTLFQHLLRDTSEPPIFFTCRYRIALDGPCFE